MTLVLDTVVQLVETRIGGEQALSAIGLKSTKALVILMVKYSIQIKYLIIQE